MRPYSLEPLVLLHCPGDGAICYIQKSVRTLGSGGNVKQRLTDDSGNQEVGDLCNRTLEALEQAVLKDSLQRVLTVVGDGCRLDRYCELLTDELRRRKAYSIV